MIPDALQIGKLYTLEEEDEEDEEDEESAPVHVGFYSLFDSIDNSSTRKPLNRRIQQELIKSCINRVFVSLQSPVRFVKKLSRSQSNALPSQPDELSISIGRAAALGDQSHVMLAHQAVPSPQATSTAPPKQSKDSPISPTSDPSIRQKQTQSSSPPFPVQPAPAPAPAQTSAPAP
eukprot:763012-Hanusia_phi.AAC.6